MINVKQTPNSSRLFFLLFFLFVVAGLVRFWCVLNEYRCFRWNTEKFANIISFGLFVSLLSVPRVEFIFFTSSKYLCAFCFFSCVLPWPYSRCNQQIPIRNVFASIFECVIYKCVARPTQCVFNMLPSIEQLLHVMNLLSVYVAWEKTIERHNSNAHTHSFRHFHAPYNLNACRQCVQL